MIQVRKSSERGHTNISWLNSYHTFSFGEYHDPEHIGFASLRVVNEDTVQPGNGFSTHAHKDMEIISYVIEGELSHQDSMGTGSVIKPGEIQRMSAGTGVEHSEFNNSAEPLHFLQIWIHPERTGIAPSYEQKSITKVLNKFILIGSRGNYEQAIIIHQHVDLYVAYMTANNTLEYIFKKNHKVWIQVVKGRLDVNGVEFSQGDGAAITHEDMLRIGCVEDGEFLLFDFV